MFFSPQLRLSAEAIFAERKGQNNYIDYEFKDYPGKFCFCSCDPDARLDSEGTAHGFASRPNLSDPQVKEAHEQSFDQTVEWFNKTIPV